MQSGVLACMREVPARRDEIFDPASGRFTLTGSMNFGRIDTTTTLLPDGRVLVAGGEGEGVVALASAEIFDPTTGNFTLTSSLNVAHAETTATLLADGRVLVAGGISDFGGTSGPRVTISTAEIFDPACGTFTLINSLNAARAYSTATLLADSRVLVAGGFDYSNGSGVGSAELYSGAPGFTPTGCPTVQLTDPTTGRSISVSFSDVTVSGNTTVTSSSSGPSLPTNFTLDNNSYYNLTTTAAFSGAVTVCIAGTGELLQYDNGAWVDVTSPGYPTASVTCGTVTSLSPFAVVHSRYSTTIQPPISAGGTSVFNASRGVVPVKFTLTLNGTPTCQLPPATIGVFRINATTAVAVNQSDFLAPSDSGSSFRIDTTNCQYIYNLNSSSLGPGTYLTQIRINGIAVGKGVFSLK